MGLSSVDEYLEHLSEQNGIVTHLAGALTVSTRLNSCYRVTGRTAHAAPTTAAAMYFSAFGDAASFPVPFTQVDPPSAMYIMGARFNPSVKTTGMYILADRLSHQGGLNATATTTQTTNLPTVALPRYTDGVGVQIGLEVYTAIGTTQTTATISYTNSDGVPGRTGRVTVGGSGNNSAGRMYLVGLDSGDKGVKSVESVTLAGTTGTAGAFGVTLYKPLYIFALNDENGPYQSDYITGGMIGTLNGLGPQTVLMFMSLAATATVTASVFLYICDGNT